MLRGAPYTNNRAIIDCCRPFGGREDFPTVAEAGPELRKRVKDRWPDLFGD